MGTSRRSVHDDPVVTLEHCPELRRLEIFENFPKERESTLISSVTSINLRTIAFLVDANGNYMRSHVLAGDFLYLDDAVCGLVDRLCASGYKHTLEIEFHLDEDDDINPNLDYTNLLAKFREKGRVRILSTSGGVMNLAVCFLLTTHIVS